MHRQAIDIFQFVLPGPRVLSMARCPSCGSSKSVQQDQMQGHIAVRCDAPSCEAAFVIDPERIRWR